MTTPVSSADAMTDPALGFCAPHDGPRFIHEQQEDLSLPVFNPSGGPQAANPVSATAMVRIAECALQVRGLAGDRQVAGVPRAAPPGQGGAPPISPASAPRTPAPRSAAGGVS